MTKHELLAALLSWWPRCFTRQRTASGATVIELQEQLVTEAQRTNAALERIASSTGAVMSEQDHPAFASETTPEGAMLSKLFAALPPFRTVAAAVLSLALFAALAFGELVLDWRTPHGDKNVRFALTSNSAFLMTRIGCWPR